jgi:glycerol transport system permease protein
LRCLCYAGLKSIPDAYYQAAQIDGASRWAVFRDPVAEDEARAADCGAAALHGQLHDLYRTFVVTGGGPGNSTTFVSIDLVKIALGQFDLGKAAALSIVYNLVILIVCWVFYTVMTNADNERAQPVGGA